jgi:anti-sigma regulatory factor (Ser/Thr protein kinase)
VLRAEIEPNALTIEIVDQGHWADYPTDHHHLTPDVDGEHGRGLRLIHLLFAQVDIRTSPQGTTIRMRQPIVL